jgi:hypothetical protein
MESSQPEAVPIKKNQTPLIIAISAAVLCCCCAVLAVAGYYGYNTMQLQETAVPTIPDDSPVPTFEPFDSVGEAPTGGLGNDILRNDTWQYIAYASIGQGCDQPLGEETIIEVLQEPQDGVWLEKWTVVCASGDSYPYEVEFILDDTGATFNITSLP